MLGNPNPRHICMRTMIRLFVFSGIMVSLHFLKSQPFAQGFTFYLPVDDTAQSLFLPKFPVAQVRPIRVKDGKFDAEGEKLRFWGVNIVSGAAFPEKNDAPFIAGRMRNMGINLVRFHHLDNPGWEGDAGSLFIGGKGTRSLNPQTLDKLEFFIAQLKKNGIYVNMNLNVSRTFTTLDGVQGADSLVDFAKGATLFDPVLIELQKEYATQLLSHVNPYTGLPLTKDPVLAMVEIANENSLYGMWKENRLNAFKQGGSLLKRQSLLLDSKWNDYLAQKYAINANLAEAWKAKANQNNPQLISDGDFEQGLSASWVLELHENAQAFVSTDRVLPGKNASSAKIQVNRITNTDWHIQFKRTGISLRKDSTYKLSFMARADKARNLTVNIMRDNDPYTFYTGNTFNLTSTWKTYTFTYTAPEDNISATRISFVLGDQTGSLWLDDISLGKPQPKSFITNEDLTLKNVTRVDFSQRLDFVPQRVADLTAFYINLQRQYFVGMRKHLKEQLGIEAPVTGTNALTGYADILNQEEMDYLDDHSYYDHPWFPNVAWDLNDWLISNTSSLKNANNSIVEAFSGLARADKPWTVSEYNHGFPNRYRSEMIPLLTNYASYHDADGLMLFDYNGGRDWRTDKVTSFFSLHRDAATMGQFPLAAYVYRNRLIASAKNVYIQSYTPEQIYQYANKDASGRWTKAQWFDKRLQLSYAIKSLPLGTGSTLPDLQTGTYRTDNSQSELNTESGILHIQTPEFVSIGGFLQDKRPFQVGPMNFLKADNFGVINWLSLDRQPLSQTRKSVLNVATRTENTGMKWLSDQTLGANWGSTPTSVESMQALVSLTVEADTLLIFPLNGLGNPGKAMRIVPKISNTFELLLDLRRDNTLWYGIESRGKGVPVNTKTEIEEKFGFHLYPNPARDYITMTFNLEKNTPLLVALYDMGGRRLDLLWKGMGRIGSNVQEIPLPLLPGGTYTVAVYDGKRHYHQLLVINGK